MTGSGFANREFNEIARFWDLVQPTFRKSKPPRRKKDVIYSLISYTADVLLGQGALGYVDRPYIISRVPSGLWLDFVYHHDHNHVEKRAEIESHFRGKPIWHGLDLENYCSRFIESVARWPSDRANGFAKLVTDLACTPKCSTCSTRAIRFDRLPKFWNVGLKVGRPKRRRANVRPSNFIGRSTRPTTTRFLDCESVPDRNISDTNSPNYPQPMNGAAGFRAQREGLAGATPTVRKPAGGFSGAPHHDLRRPFRSKTQETPICGGCGGSNSPCYTGRSVCHRGDQAYITMCTGEPASSSLRTLRTLRPPTLGPARDALDRRATLPTGRRNRVRYAA